MESIVIVPFRLFLMILTLSADIDFALADNLRIIQFFHLN